MENLRNRIKIKPVRSGDTETMYSLEKKSTFKDLNHTVISVVVLLKIKE